MNTASKTRHVFILFLADIVWGIAFVAQSKGGDAVGAFSFNGIRFLIGIYKDNDFYVAGNGEIKHFKLAE